MITLRGIRPEDAVGIASAMKLTTEEAERLIAEWDTKRYNGAYFEMFGVFDDDAPAGLFSLYEHSKSVVSIGAEIFVPYRRKGYGKTALRRMITEAGERGYSVILQQVRTDNTASIRLHEALGFEKDNAVYKNQKGNDVFLYLKALGQNEAKEGLCLTTYTPKREDLWFKQRMMADEETMSYNHAWGGTIPFPHERWAEWHDHWIVDHEGKRFYRYLKDKSGVFVGEIAYHFDEELNGFSADVVIYAKYRARGYGGMALEMLCAAARENGIEVLYDEIAVDNPAAALFRKHGFAEISRTEETVTLAKKLETDKRILK